MLIWIAELQDCKERAGKGKNPTTTAFCCKIHELNNSGREEGLSTGESCDRKKTTAVAEGDRLGNVLCIEEEAANLVRSRTVSGTDILSEALMRAPYVFTAQLAGNQL